VEYGAGLKQPTQLALSPSIQPQCPAATLILLHAPKVKANGLIVFVPRYGIEGSVYLTPKDGEGGAAADGQQQFVLDEERQARALVCLGERCRCWGGEEL